MTRVEHYDYTALVTTKSATKKATSKPSKKMSAMEFVVIISHPTVTLKSDSPEAYLPSRHLPAQS